MSSSFGLVGTATGALATGGGTGGGAAGFRSQRIAPMAAMPASRTRRTMAYFALLDGGGGGRLEGGLISEGA